MLMYLDDKFSSRDKLGVKLWMDTDGPKHTEKRKEFGDKQCFRLKSAKQLPLVANTLLCGRSSLCAENKKN